MKRLGIFLLILLPLLIGLVVALPYIVTSDSMRVQFARQVSSASGMDIQLNGPVHLTMFPTLGMVADNVGFALPDGSLSATANRMSSGVKFSTLFGSKIEITGIELKEPVIELVSSDQSPDQNVQQPENSGAPDTSDPVKSAIAYLESVSLNSLKISDGRFVSRGPNGATSEISEINVALVAPDLDGEIELDLSAVNQGQKITANGSLAALRPILERRPVGVDFAVEITPPPHPALAKLNLKGNVQLVEDSYQIEGGVLETLGQPLSMNVLYRPGDRPYAFASLAADVVDLGILNPAEKKSETSKAGLVQSEGASAAPDLSILRDMDADINVKIGKLVVDGVEAADIDLAATLKDGLLGFDLANTSIANGQLALALNGDANQASPVIKGTLTAKSLGISNLAALAGQKIPADGKLNINLGYAFQGASEAAIRKSLNLAGNINLSGVDVSVPALRDLGPGADKITNMNVDVAIENITKPVSLAGDLGWKGERLVFRSKINPRNFVTDQQGNVSTSLTSRRINAEFNGLVSVSGTARGNAKLSTKSVDGLLAWLGQGGDAGIGPFSFSGGIDVSPDQVAFSKANLNVNGIAASGSGKATLEGKPYVTTNLSFGELNLATLIGADASSGGGSSGQSQNNASSDVPLDLSGLNSVNADIRISAKKLGYGKVFAGPVSTTLTIKDGVGVLQVPNAGFYGGSVAARLDANGAAAVPQIGFEANLQNVNALPLLRDAGEFERVEGVLNAAIKTSGSGATTGQLRRSLTGNAETRFRDGAIRGIDIAKIYNNLASVLSGGLKQNSSDKTEFTEMGLTMAINNGVASTNDLRLIGPLVRMDGAGSVNFGEETINMRLNPKLVASAQGQGGEFDVSGLSIPVIVEGQLDQPRVYPDLTGVLKNPQAALQSLSKIGLNIKGLKLDKVGDSLDIGKLAKDKLGLDKLSGENTGKVTDLVGGLLNKKTSEETGNGQVGDLIGGLLGQNNKNQDSGDSSAGNLVGSLLGNLGGNQTDQPVQPTEPAQPAPQSDAGTTVGGIPIPQPNPRKRGGVAATQQPANEVVQEPAQLEQKTVTEQVVDQIIPETNADGEEDPARKSLNNLLKGVLQNNGN